MNQSTNSAMFGEERASIAPEEAAKPRRSGPSPAILIALMALAGLLLFTVMRERNKKSLTAGMPEAPALFAAAKPCSHSGSAALGAGRELEQAAMAKAERQRFDAHDGIEAVALYDTAASCYSQGGDAESAGRAKRQLDQWQARMGSLYQAHQLRLRLALDRGAHRDARRELGSLKVLLPGQAGPYMAWLDKVERSLPPEETKCSKRKKKKK
jgi:hypothetical protein